MRPLARQRLLELGNPPLESSMKAQLDIFDHDPARLAAKSREAAQHALAAGNQGYFTAQERYEFHTAEAERLERLASMAVAA